MEVSFILMSLKYELLLRFNVPPEYVNAHYCKNIAETVERLVDGAEAVWCDEVGAGHGEHCIISYRGRYYDIENSAGATDPNDLVYLERTSKIEQIVSFLNSFGG